MVCYNEMISCYTDLASTVNVLQKFVQYSELYISELCMIRSCQKHDIANYKCWKLSQRHRPTNVMMSQFSLPLLSFSAHSNTNCVSWWIFLYMTCGMCEIQWSEKIKESDKSLKNELGTIGRSSVSQVPCWSCGSILVSTKTDVIVMANIFITKFRKLSEIFKENSIIISFLKISCPEKH